MKVNRSITRQDLHRWGFPTLSQVCPECRIWPPFKGKCRNRRGRRKDFDSSETKGGWRALACSTFAQIRRERWFLSMVAIGTKSRRCARLSQREIGNSLLPSKVTRSEEHTS